MVFEKEYVFRGKHADMVKRMVAKESDGIGRGFFETNYQIYLVAPLVGWAYQQRARVDKGADNTTKVFPDKITKHRQDLLFTYHTLMALYWKEKGLEKEELVDMVFGLDDKDEERKECDAIYNSYVLGGVEILYSKIFKEKDAIDIDGYVMNLYEFVEDLGVRLGSVTPELG